MNMNQSVYTRSMNNTSTYAVLPFSRQGVILAIIVSPFRNLVPPLNSVISKLGTARPKGTRVSIAIFFARVPLFIVSLGLKLTISLSFFIVQLLILVALSYIFPMCYFYVALFYHCILQGGIYSLVSEQLLQLFYRHAFIYRHCCERSSEFMRMYLVDSQTLAHFSQSKFHSAD